DEVPGLPRLGQEDVGLHALGAALLQAVAELAEDPVVGDAVGVDLEDEAGRDGPVVAQAALPAAGVVDGRLLQEEAAGAAAHRRREHLTVLAAEALAELGVKDRRD